MKCLSDVSCKRLATYLLHSILAFRMLAPAAANVPNACLPRSRPVCTLCQIAAEQLIALATVPSSNRTLSCPAHL